MIAAIRNECGAKTTCRSYTYHVFHCYGERQVVDVLSARLCGLFMAVVRVLDEVEWETRPERERKADVLDVEDVW